MPDRGTDEVGDRTTDDPDSPSETVIVAVAARKGVDPAALPPLHDAIDQDALDRAVRSDGSVRVSFEYAGYEVRVTGRDAVELTRLGE